MDTHAVQLRQQIERTRTAMTANLDRLEWHASHSVAAILEQAVVVPIRGVQEAVARGTALLHRVPWVIIVAGGLLGYHLSRLSERPARVVQNPPERATAVTAFEPPLGGAGDARSQCLHAAAAGASGGPTGV
jgi:hypothetical protein